MARWELKEEKGREQKTRFGEGGGGWTDERQHVVGLG